MAVLKLENVKVGYSDYALFCVRSLRLCAGEIVVVVGENAAGKSSLIKGLFGVEAWIRGDVFYDNERILFIRRELIASGQVSWIPQRRLSFDGISVRDVLRAVMIFYSARDFAQRLRYLIERIPGLDALLDADTGKCSGGEKGTVMLAVAMINFPNLMFLDEPFAGVDKDRIVPLVSCVKQFVREQNTACLIVEHRRDVIETLGATMLAL